jgi:DNA-binding LacI/PurR family transcriptional regulator
MGRWAGETLIDLLDDAEATPPTRLTMPCPLVRRSSVAPL